MSYDKVIEQLKNPAIKIDKLAQYAQGQNPAVPEFLALAEIKRRQSLVAHSPAPAQTTVQEDLTRSAMPQPQQMAGLQAMQRPQGVAALPSGMDGGSYAGGGIVAFDGNNGSLVEDEQAQMDRDALKYGWARTKAAARDILTLPGRGLAGAFETAVTRPVRAMGVDMPYLPRSFYGGDAASLTPHMDALNRQAATPMTSDQVKKMMPAEATGEDESKLYAAEAVAKKISPKGEALPTVGERGRMAATTQADRNADGSLKNPQEDMYARYEKMLTEQGAESKAARNQDKYMRLLEAGLGIMGGTSQHALTNIGQGAMGAAKGYAQDKAGYRKEDRENIKELMGLGMKKEEAQREAEKLAIMRKEAEDKGGYYGAYADYLKSGKGGGAGSGTKLQIAQDRNAVALYNKWLAGNPMATPEEQNAAWLRSQQMAGAGGGAAGPATNTVQWGSLGAKS